MVNQTTLNELKKSLATLQEPYSIASLTNLFSEHQLLVSTQCEEIDPLYSEWKALNTIYNLCLKWQEHNQRRLNLQEQDQKLKIAKKQIKQTSTLLADLQNQYLQSEQRIEPEFQRLLDEFNALRIKLTPVAVPFIAPDLEAKISTLNEYCILLDTEINRISFDVDRLALHENNTQRQAIISQLKKLTVIVPLSCGLEELPALKIQVKEQLQDIQKKEQLLKDFDEQFVQYLSQKLTEQISQLKLDPITVRKVTAQFNYATDKNALLNKLQTKLTKNNSYLNPYAWRNWATRKEFKQEIEAQTLELQLMQLLLLQDDLNNKSLDIDQQLTKQKSILNSINPATSPLRVTIPAEILDLLSLSSDQVTTINDTVLLNKLIAQIKALNSQITGFKKALELLTTLTDIENAAFVIHTNAFNKLKVNCSTPINDTDALALRKSQKEQPLKREKLEVSLASCKQCLGSLKELKSLVERINNTRTELNPPKTKGHKKRQEQRVAEEAELNNKITELQTTITHEINEVKKIDSPEKQPEKKIKTQYQTLWDQLNQWNTTIELNSKNMPGEWQTWYKKLFAVLQENALEETSLLQAIQLFRDIYFELSYANTGVMSEVLGEYYFQHANPSTNYKDLLNLKPALALVTKPDELAPLSDKTMQKRMNKLYTHQHDLAARFPKEAELLKQAALNFHQMALCYENKKRIAKPVNPAFYTDPRYQCLEKHRGLGKAWEWLAELCTKLLNKISGTPSSDYRHRFFFVPTQSCQLMKNAATAINERAMK